ncbi:MAG: Rpn family recombination-promoting nuclease/putative transposase [Amoebophilaceae bacterium]|nr:Rpn family recombination-promoting nuclease/putative transposase [Amoebophilaceae bacterium]
MSQKLKHDPLSKAILRDPVVAKAFLAYYLPDDFKHILDLTKITIEPESYIEETLKQKYSDIVYRVKTKNHGTSFAYILLEAQSSVDYWTALRLWKYTLLLCERHPSLLPIMAKQCMTADYQLVDLQSMADDAIISKQHLGMLEYMLKHIHERDMIMLWEKFLQTFKSVILIDKEKGYIYLTYFLRYTNAKLPEERQVELVNLLNKYLSEEEQGKIMRTVAQKYIEKGKFEGIKIGEARGEARGKATLLKTMIANGNSI